MWVAAAAEAPEQSYALLNIVFIFAGVVVTVAGGVITALINKSAKATVSQPPEQTPTPSPPDPGAEVRYIVRQLQERADDCDKTSDVMDRRLERHEIYLEIIARAVGVELPHPYQRRTPPTS